MNKKTRNRKTTKVRAAFTLDIDVLDTLDEFSKVTGQSKSGLVNDCVRQAMPQLKKMVELFKYAKENPTADLSHIQAEFFKAINEADESLDQLTKE
tara:strand:- start:74 stop:361 length:288 start_codon:yes stop_codon:yes gene_type:complete